jgi:hypothetical protein
MGRVFTVAFGLLIFTGVVFAQFSHPPIGPGSIVPIGPSAGSNGVIPPSSCTGVLDLSTGCAQLLAIGALF